MQTALPFTRVNKRVRFADLGPLSWEFKESDPEPQTNLDAKTLLTYRPSTLEL